MNNNSNRTSTTPEDDSSEETTTPKLSSSNSSSPVVTTTTTNNNNNKKKAKSDTKQNRIGEIKVTRNIRARKVDKRIEPINFPESGVLYEFNVKDWENKMAFYDQIAYSFGVPSTQKTVFCSYLNCHVMHYERTCQGVYYCPHINDSDNNIICTVKPCRYRFQQCEHHKTSLKKSDERCKLKLHFYVPKDTTNHIRLLLCIGDHNHPLIPETYQIDGTTITTRSSPLTPMSATSDSALSPIDLENTTDVNNRSNLITETGYMNQMRNHHSSTLTNMDSNLPPQYSAHPPQYYHHPAYHYPPQQQHQQQQLDNHVFYTTPPSSVSFNYSHPIPAKVLGVNSPPQYRNNNTMPVPAYQPSTSLNMQVQQQNIVNAQKKRLFTLMNGGVPAPDEDAYRPAKRVVLEDRTPAATSNVLPSISTFFVSEQAPQVTTNMQPEQKFQQQMQQPSIPQDQVYYTRTHTVHQQVSMNPPGYYQVISQQKVQQGPPVYQQAPPPYRFQ
jgi:hypothetical protein